MANKKVYIVVCNTCAYAPNAIYGVFDKSLKAIICRDKLNQHFKNCRSFEIIKQDFNIMRELKDWEK